MLSTATPTLGARSLEPNGLAQRTRRGAGGGLSAALCRDTAQQRSTPLSPREVHRLLRPSRLRRRRLAGDAGRALPASAARDWFLEKSHCAGHIRASAAIGLCAWSIACGFAHRRAGTARARMPRYRGCVSPNIGTAQEPRSRTRDAPGGQEARRLGAQAADSNVDAPGAQRRRSEDGLETG